MEAYTVEVMGEASALDVLDVGDEVARDVTMEETELERAVAMGPLASAVEAVTELARARVVVVA